MKHLLPAILACTASGAVAQAPAAIYPSCNLAEQRALPGETGGTITDPRQAHLSVRANILQADLGTAHKAGRIGRRQADRLWQRVDRVRHESDRFVAKQGFLSAAERASYDRELDAVATTMCR